MENKDFKKKRKNILDIINGQLNSFWDLKGEVFSSGLDSLVNGDIYIVGLNPMYGTKYRTIREHVESWSFSNYSAFRDQCWQKSCWEIDCYGFQNELSCSCKRGDSKHQKAVLDIIEIIKPKCNPSTIFATNAVFVCSKSADNFSKEHNLSLSDAFEICWPIHQFFLSIVRPKIIICLGLSEYNSSYSLFKKKGNVSKFIDPLKLNGRKFPSIKCDNACFIIDNLELKTKILGIRHPSYVCDASVPEFKNIIQSILN